MASSREEGARPVAVRSGRQDGWRPAGSVGGKGPIVQIGGGPPGNAGVKPPFVIPAKAGIQVSWERLCLARGGGSRVWTRGAAPAPHEEIRIRSPGLAAGLRERGGEGGPDHTLGHGVLGTLVSRPHWAVVEPPRFVCRRDARVPRRAVLSGGPCVYPETPGEWA